MAGVWQGIERGWAAHEKRMADKEDREYKERQEERIEKEFNETRMLRRVKSVSDFLGDRGSLISVDTAKLSSIKRALGNVEGANDYLAKLAASPYAVDTVYKALEDRKSATGTMPTGQELMDNITLIAENYGDESWMKSYKEGRDIYDILLRDPDKLLEDEYFSSVMSRIGALPDVVKPTVGVDITPGYTTKLTPAMINEQVDQFDDAILAYANNQLSQYPDQEVSEAVDLSSDIGNYSDDPTALRQRFGSIVLHELRQSGGILFQPGLAPNLAPYSIPIIEIQNLKRAAETNKREEAIRKFNEAYGPGQAELFLGV
tara:strand:- start:724 stop:1674 length:951 start_codon:yes stop_codon:yes gene_type:complete